MKFTFFTPEETDLLHQLQLEIVELLDEYPDLFTQELSFDLSQKEKYSEITNYCLLGDSTEYQDPENKLNYINKQKEDIFNVAYSRFEEYVSSNAEEYLRQVDETLSLYTDSLGISFLRDFYDKFGEDTYKKLALSEITSELQRSIGHIYYPFLNDESNEPVKEVANLIDRSIKDKAVRILDKFDKLLTEFDNSDFHDEQLDGQLSFFELSNDGSPQDESKSSISKENYILNAVSPDYTFYHKSYFPVLHGKATNEFSRLPGKKLDHDSITDNYFIESGNIKFIIDGSDKFKGTVGVSLHKLLITAVSIFAKENHTGHKVRKVYCKDVKIPLKEYARICGVDADSETALKNFRKKVNNSLETLFCSRLSWKEKVKGRFIDYEDQRIITKKGIKNGHITISFVDEFADYLIKLPITQYPSVLLKIDERKTNAYSIGVKLSQHYNNDNNMIKNTYNLLKVKNLLQVTSLPNIDDNSVKKNGWENRIKEPFESAFDDLTQCGLLTEWRYSHPKGKEMNDDEANFKNYQEWSDTLIYFVLKDAPNHKERLQARNDEKAKAEEKNTYRKSKRKKKKSE